MVLLESHNELVRFLPGWKSTNSENNCFWYYADRTAFQIDMNMLKTGSLYTLNLDKHRTSLETAKVPRLTSVSDMIIVVAATIECSAFRSQFAGSSVPVRFALLSPQTRSPPHNGSLLQQCVQQYFLHDRQNLKVM